MKKKILISAGTLALAIVLGVSAYFLFFFEDKLLTAVENGDSETAVTLYTEKIADNQRKVEKYKEIFSEQLDILWDDFQNTKIDFETAEKQAKVIKDIGILPKADEVCENIIQLNNSRTALAAGNRAAEQGDYKTAVLEYKKVTEKNDQFQPKMDAAVEGYKSQFNTDFDNALNNNDYETARNLYIELKETLPDDTVFCKRQEEKISNSVLSKIEENDIENGMNLFQTLGEFITDTTVYKQCEDLIAETKAIQNTWNSIQGWWKYENPEGGDLNIRFDSDGRAYCMDTSMKIYGTYSVTSPNTIKVFYTFDGLANGAALPEPFEEEYSYSKQDDLLTDLSVTTEWQIVTYERGRSSWNME